MKQQLWQRRAYLLADVDTVREVLLLTSPGQRSAGNAIA